MKLELELDTLEHKSHSLMNTIYYHKKNNKMLLITLNDYKRKVKSTQKLKEKFLLKRRVQAIHLKNIRKAYLYNKKQVYNNKLVQREMSLSDELIANVYKTGLTLSYQNTSNILSLICEHFKININPPKKSKIANIVHEQIACDKQQWNEIMMSQPCTLSFDIASAESFPYLQIITSIPKLNPKKLSEISKSPTLQLNKEGYSFELVKEFQAVELVQHASELMKLPTKEASNVYKVVSDHISQLQLHPMFYMTDGGSENIGRKKGATTQLSKDFKGVKVVCSAHRLHTTCEKALSEIFSDQSPKTIDWIIRFVRSNWNKMEHEHIPKPKLVLKTRWLTYLKGAEYILQHQKNISQLLANVKSNTSKAIRAKETFENPEFWICSHILAGFGHIFFVPAFTWIQVDKGRRAPLMAKQVCKWLLLLKHIEKSPSTYFSSTLLCAQRLRFSEEQTFQLISSFARVCYTNIEKYFGDWFKAPLNLAFINDPLLAEKLIEDIRTNPEQYDLLGFRSEKVFAQFMAYTSRSREGISLSQFKDLYHWWIVTFSSLSAHNIGCERAFSVMRYIHRSKLSANTPLQSYLIQHVFDDEKVDRADFVNGLLDDDLEDEDLIQIIEETFQVLEEGSGFQEAYQVLEEGSSQKHSQSHVFRAEEITMKLINAIGSVMVAVASVSNAISNIVAAISQVTRQQLMNYCLEMECGEDKQYGFEKLVPQCIE